MFHRMPYGPEVEYGGQHQKKKRETGNIRKKHMLPIGAFVKNVCYKKRSEANGYIGDVENGPMPFLVIKVYEVNNITQAHPVDEISGGSAENAGEAEAENF